jgi:hypothetical protein
MIVRLIRHHHHIIGRVQLQVCALTYIIVACLWFTITKLKTTWYPISDLLGIRVFRKMARRGCSGLQMPVWAEDDLIRTALRASQLSWPIL